MIGPDAFRSQALAFPGASESPHFDRASFRVNKRIFATLDAPRERAVVKLSQADREACLDSQPEVFHSVGWAQQGWTGIELQEIDPGQAHAMLELAWKNVAPRSAVRQWENPGEA